MLVGKVYHPFQHRQMVAVNLAVVVPYQGAYAPVILEEPGQSGAEAKVTADGEDADTESFTVNGDAVRHFTALRVKYRHADS